MSPILVTLYGNDSPTCRATLGGDDRGPSVDLSKGYEQLGVDWANLVSTIGKGIGKVAESVGGARAKREKDKQAAEAARLQVIALTKRKTLLYVGIGGGVLLIAGGAFVLTRKRGKRGNR